MTTMLRRFYGNPDVMIPWCERVGLDPERIPVNGFSIEHDGPQHVAVYQLAGEQGEPFAPSANLRLEVNVLPFPCKRHPDVPAIGLANGRAKEVAGGE